MRQSYSTRTSTGAGGKAAGVNTALLVALTATELLIGIPSAYSSEPQGGCATEGGYFLTPASENAHFQAIDLELGNGDGFVCVKTLPHGAGERIHDQHHRQRTAERMNAGPNAS